LISNPVDSTGKNCGVSKIHGRDDPTRNINQQAKKRSGESLGDQVFLPNKLQHREENIREAQARNPTALETNSGG
jgi:hypothetical protein